MEIHFCTHSTISLFHFLNFLRLLVFSIILIYFISCISSSVYNVKKILSLCLDGCLYLWLEFLYFSSLLIVINPMFDSLLKTFFLTCPYVNIFINISESFQCFLIFLESNNFVSALSITLVILTIFSYFLY